MGRRRLGKQSGGSCRQQRWPDQKRKDRSFTPTQTISKVGVSLRDVQHSSRRFTRHSFIESFLFGIFSPSPIQNESIVGHHSIFRYEPLMSHSESISYADTPIAGRFDRRLFETMWTTLFGRVGAVESKQKSRQRLGNTTSRWD